MTTQLRAPRPTRRLVRRLARRLGLDRNPMRRRSDRVESALLLAATVLVVVATAVGVVLGGRVAGAGLRRAATEQAARHRAVAVLLAGAEAPTGRVVGPGPVLVAARASWTVGGRTYTGTVDARQGTARGARVTIWVDGRGRPVEAPYTRADAVADGVGSGFSVPGGALLLAVVGWWLARWRLDRARFAVWDEDWSRVEPGWTGRTRR